MTTKYRGWHLAPTGPQLIALREMSSELGYTMPSPTNRDEARRLMAGYKAEKKKRGML